MLKPEELTDDERVLLIDALNIRRCIIETGTIIYTAQDAISAGRTDLVRRLHPS